jgi:sortase A
VKALRLFSLLFLVGGACLTGRAAYLHAKAKLAGVLIHRAWEQSLLSGESGPPWPWADTRPIARLIIPRLKYDEIVLEGATPRTLAFGPALMLNGSGLGKPGNLLLAGHRTSWFLPLESIALGDTIRLQWFDARRRELVERTYTVRFIRVVDPRDVSLLEPTSEDALTLVTCYPFGHRPTSPQRFQVRASPLGPSHPAQFPAAQIGHFRSRGCPTDLKLPEQHEPALLGS